MHPGRQNMITQVAVVSFFESVFATDAATRRAAHAALAEGLARDFDEVTYRAAESGSELVQ
jgi:hypothetical protein